MYLMIGQVVFVLSGYATNIVLSRMLGVEQYGIFGVVMSVLVWVELGVIVGIPTALQKFIAENHQHAYTLRRIGFGIQLKYSLAVFLLFFASAGLLANALNDHELAFYLRVASVNIVIYALYRFFLGVHNGLKNFGKQTIASIIYAVGKLAAIVALIWQGAAVAGALMGNALGSALGLCAAIMMKPNLERVTQAFDKSKIIRYAVPIILFTLLVNLFLAVDLWFVKAFLDSTAAGYYVAASTVARVPYFLFLALCFTLLPSLARALKHDLQQAKSLVWQSTRILLVCLALIVILVMASAPTLMDLLFTELYAPAIPVLQILIWGLSFLTFFSVFATMLNVDDRPASAFWISSIVVALNLALNLWAVPAYGITGAAWATTASTFIGMIWSGVVVYRKFNLRLDVRSIFRVAVAAGVAFLLGAQVANTAAMLLLKYVVITSAYAGMLYLIGEIRAQEVSRLAQSLFSHGKEKTTDRSVSQLTL